MEILSSLGQPQATTPASPGKGGAKSDAEKKGAAAKKPAASKSADQDIDYLGQCLRDWDAATHMTRTQWARTCRRVAASRERYLREFQGK